MIGSLFRSFVNVKLVELIFRKCVFRNSDTSFSLHSMSLINFEFIFIVREFIVRENVGNVGNVLHNVLYKFKCC